MRYPLPNDTSETLRTQVNRISNLGLALDKYLKVYEATDTDASNRQIGNDDVWKYPPEIRLRKWAISHTQINAEMRTMVQHAATRQLAMLQALSARHFTAAPDYRLAVGFGAEHVLETNLYLHRIYGFPIIPGSAAKGLARAAAFWELAQALQIPALDFDELEQRKTEARRSPLQMLDTLLQEGDEGKQERFLEDLQDDSACTGIEPIQTLTLADWHTRANDFYAVFGTQQMRGSVTFFDAYPTRAPMMKTDILNPHFPDYYSDTDKTTPPSDRQNPKPTYFLTVAAGQPFRFAVAGQGAEKAETWLRQGLTALGIGGKTSGGYGFMLPT